MSDGIHLSMGLSTMALYVADIIMAVVIRVVTITRWGWSCRISRVQKVLLFTNTTITVLAVVVVDAIVGRVGWNRTAPRPCGYKTRRCKVWSRSWPA